MMVTIMLLIVIAILIAFLFLFKREIRSIRQQLCQRSRGIEKPIDVSFIDKDVTDLASEINNAISYQKEQSSEIFKREKQLKEAISNISHDLRTPLTSIIGHLQLLHKTELEPEQREFVETILARSQDLRTLISNFYDISVLESKESIPELKMINLDNILTDIILACTEEFKNKDMTPHISFLDKPTFVIADEIMLKRVIYNLVTNAISYGTSELNVTILRSNKISVEFKNTVVDNQTIDTNRIFDKFYRADLSRNYSGTGLGLYIVKLLMKKMDGTANAIMDNEKLCITLLFTKTIDQ